MPDHPEVALYGHWICPFATRVRFALAQRGIEHELVDVPPSAVRGVDFVLPPEFVRHSPKLEIPMVRIGDDHLADSIPILEWLEVRIDAPPLLPRTPARRELVRERMTWIDRSLFRSMIGVYYGVDPAEIDRAAGALAASLARLSRWIDEDGWLAGNEPTLAEAVMIPFHVRLDGLHRLGFDHPVPGPVDDHRTRCTRLHGWDAVAWTDDQTDEFVGRFEAFRRKQRRR